MPVSLSCPACGARLKAPDNAAGRTFRCPKCQGPVVVPASGPTAFAFGTTAGPADDDGNPFADAGVPDEPQTFDADDAPRKARRPTAKKKPAPGSPPVKRRYRKYADDNPFGDAPVEEVPDPVGEGFEFGVEAPPAAPAGEFDFGPLDPHGEDEDGPGRRRR
jgi:hypothetical protein